MSFYEHVSEKNTQPFYKPSCVNIIFLLLSLSFHIMIIILYFQVHNLILYFHIESIVLYYTMDTNLQGHFQISKTLPQWGLDVTK